MSGPLVSVIVPVFNAELFLDELCQSLQAQTHSHFEALFLDDGSTDQSRTVLAKYSGDPRFSIFSWEKNRGVTEATIELLQKMRGEFWCHPGADDVLEPGFIEERLKAAKSFPDAVLIHGPGQVIDERGRPLVLPLAPREMPQQLGSERALGVIIEHNVINTPAVFVNAEVTRQILEKFRGGWRYAQDWFLWILHLASGRTLVWQSEPLHKYRVHSNSLSGHPGHAAVRLAETRLVPLCALSAAQSISPWAARCWRRWRSPLYALWLRRAWKLHQTKQLDPLWLEAGARAFHGTNHAPNMLGRECARYMIPIATATLRESLAQRANRFAVAGLAQIGDPLFH